MVTAGAAAGHPGGTAGGRVCGHRHRDRVCAATLSDASARPAVDRGRSSLGCDLRVRAPASARIRTAAASAALPPFGPPPRLPAAHDRFARTTDQDRRSSTLPARRPARSAPSSPGERPSTPASSPPTARRAEISRRGSGTTRPDRAESASDDRRSRRSRPLPRGGAITPTARRRRSWSACRPPMSTTRCCGCW